MVVASRSSCVNSVTCDGLSNGIPPPSVYRGPLNRASTLGQHCHHDAGMVHIGTTHCGHETHHEETQSLGISRAIVRESSCAATSFRNANAETFRPKSAHRRPSPGNP